MTGHSLTAVSTIVSVNNTTTTAGRVSGTLCSDGCSSGLEPH